MVAGQNVKVSMEVEDDRTITIFLGHHADCVLLLWPAAYDLAALMQEVIDDVKDDTDPIDMEQLIREQKQIKLNIYDGKLALVFAWGDRFRYHWRSLQVLQQALRIKTQDLQFAERQVILPTLTREQGKRIRKLKR
jgi:tagatose-1,6-bisphosphate aldolase non-catalytic subunit AgaZ/GatZ